MDKSSNTKKRLLVDAHTFDENLQGIRTFLKGIYQAIRFDFNDVEVIMAAHDINKLKLEFKDQKHFKYVQLKYESKYLRLAYEIPAIIKKLHIDFAHFNYYLPLFLNRNCKYIVTIHDVLFIDYPQFFPVKYRLVNTLLFKRSAHKADVLTTVSEYSKERIRTHFDIPDKEITILHNAVDHIYLKNNDKQKDKRYIKTKFGIGKYLVFVSRFEPRKNHSLLLKVYKELRLWEKDYSLVFIGRESFKMQELQQEIEEVKNISKGNLHILHDIDNEDLVKFYNAAELSVFPSLCEGFGIPPLESVVLNTPTLCSNTTAMSDFNFFGDYLFDPRSGSQLKTLITKIINLKLEPDLDQISEEVKARYSWSKTSSILSDLIINIDK